MKRNDVAPAARVPLPAVGELVADIHGDTLGTVMGHVGGRVQLRPPGGGREWDALPERLRPPTVAERLSAGVREANRRSVRGRGEVR